MRVKHKTSTLLTSNFVIENGCFSLIFFLLFVTPPFFADAHHAGKAIFFTLSVLCLGLTFSRPGADMNISRFYLFFMGFCLLAFFSMFGPSLRFDSVLRWCVLLNVFIFWSIFTDHCVRFEWFSRRFLSVFLLLGVVSASLCLYQLMAQNILQRNVGIPFLFPPMKGTAVSGMFGQPNLFALFLSVVLLVFFYYYLHHYQFFTALPVLRFAPLIIIAIVFFSTGSRGGMLGLLVSLSLLSWFELKSGPPHQKIELCKLLVCLVLAYFIADFFTVSFVEKNHLTDPLLGSSTMARLLLWVTAVMIFIDYPILGVGLDGFKFYQSKYIIDAFDWLGIAGYEAMVPSAWVHNELFQTLCEVGIFAGLFVGALLLIFFYLLISQFFRSDIVKAPIFFYSHLFILPFIVQGMFSWPFRYLPLLVLFFAFIGLLCSQYPLKKIYFGGYFAYFIRSVFCLGLVVSLLVAFQEVRMGNFKRNLLTSFALEDTFDDFERLSKSAYGRYYLLYNALPIYVSYVQKRNKIDLALRVTPYAEELVSMEGNYSQWYNLSLLYGISGFRQKAHSAIERAINLKPDFQLAWQYQHHLNMLEASRITGRPLQDFRPVNNEENNLNAVREMLNSRN